jgi:regulation of enolase protein 1 (concanavalin A-like superfamily)
MFGGCRWLNEPKKWHLRDGRLTVTTDDGTDFWRQTLYGFTRDSGHFYGRDVEGDFTAQLNIRARYAEQYDQAGIMIRLDESRWVKAGIELCDGRCSLGSVLTIGSSDWATGVFEGDAENFWIRATVSEGVLRLQASADGKVWPLLRLCPFPVANRYSVGAMCCTPQRAGLSVEFGDFAVTAPLGKDLHDLT